MAQSVSRHSIAVKARVRSLENHVTFVGGGQNDTGICFCPGKSVLLCQYRSAFAAEIGAVLLID